MYLHIKSFSQKISDRCELSWTVYETRKNCTSCSSNKNSHSFCWDIGTHIIETCIWLFFHLFERHFEFAKVYATEKYCKRDLFEAIKFCFVLIKNCKNITGFQRFENLYVKTQPFQNIFIKLLFIYFYK